MAPTSIEHAHLAGRSVPSVFNQMVDNAPAAGPSLLNQVVEYERSASGPMSVDPLSRVFAALADPTRRDIVARLAAGDATLNELAPL